MASRVEPTGSPFAKTVAAESLRRTVGSSRSFDFYPPPPKQDLLAVPMRVADLPLDSYPTENWRSRWARFLATFQIGRHGRETRLRWRFYDTVNAVAASVAKSSGNPLSTKINRELLAAARSGLRHPYALRAAFDLLRELPEGFDAERDFLDRLLAVILDRFAGIMAQIRVRDFRFSFEARDNLISAYKAEKLLYRITDPQDRADAIREIHGCYYVGSNYYLYALTRREELEANNQLFLLYCCGAYYTARIESDGSVVPSPDPRRLPNRKEILFYALRDITVLRRFKGDPDYAKELRETLRSFPA